MLNLKSIFDSIGRVVKTVYRGESLGIEYEQGKVLSAKALVESLQAFIVLYAAYAEVSRSFLQNLFSIEAYPLSVSAVGRMISGTIGIMVCFHILHSTRFEGGRQLYTYGKLSRRIAHVVMALVIIALVMAIKDVVTIREAYPATPFASFSMNSEEWQDLGNSGQGSANARTYEALLKLPEQVKKQTGNLLISISPSHGYRLVNVYPNHGMPVETKQEVIKMSEPDIAPSRWLFPNFEEAAQWKITVTLTKTDQNISFPKHAPILAELYVAKSSQ
ncbi:MAG TPA: hypothetical protein VE135_10225 [Pyrinomonadaceae bacterium]|nr:hypothetical protein [Pyrinomonadaceae bacterium]